MKMSPSKRFGTLYGLISKKKAEPTEQVRFLHPASELAAALVPTDTQPKRTRARRANDSEIPIPSDERFARQFLRVWTRRLMLLCAVGAICAALAVPLLSCLKVKEITVGGHSHYDAQTLIEQTQITVGDELLACAPVDIQSALLQGCPYLATVSVDRSLLGMISITVTERTPRWALQVSDQTVALVDESLYVLEIGDKDTLAASQCIVKFELFPPTDEDEATEKEESGDEPQTLVVGKTYSANEKAIAKLSTLSQALQTVSTAQPPVLIDMSDPYAITVRFSDGTTFALHECADALRQLRAAVSALEAYRVQSGEMGPVLVDVDDFSRVSLRPMT